MKRVHLYAEDAQALVDKARGKSVREFELVRAIERTKDALHPRPSEKKLVAKREHRAAKTSKRAARNAETARIYAEVEKRAGGVSEASGIPFSPADPPELDHAFGRGRVPQTVRNCWLISRSEHRARTNPEKARPHLERFIAHCERYGFHAEAERARARLEGIVTARERSRGEFVQAKGATT